jgi:hypothetical protein
MRWERAWRALIRQEIGPPVHRAELLMSTHLLHEMLMMPDTMRIVGVTMYGNPHTVTLSVEDATLRPVYEGQLVPEIEPVFSTGTPDGELMQAAWPLTVGAEPVVVGDVFPDDDPVKVSS